MRRGINESLSIRKEKPASRTASAAVYKFHVTAVDVHAEDLITLKRRPGGLEYEFCAVKGKVGFSVLTAKGELLQVLQVRLPLLRVPAVDGSAALTMM